MLAVAEGLGKAKERLPEREEARVVSHVVQRRWWRKTSGGGG